MDNKITIVTVHCDNAPGLSGVLTPNVLNKVSTRTGLTYQQVMLEIEKLSQRQMITIEHFTLH